ncbi:MAG: spheroidene monooxygenase [Ferruginibacter sp.]|nr:spheroidene monooxygenase [Cytophagales bacterium]
MSPTLTTFTVFLYDSPNRLWAFQRMGLLPGQLAKVPGMAFSQLMGSGRGLVFSLWPDWSRYVLLATWTSEEAADAFFGASPLVQAFRRQARETWTVRMHPIKTHGLWSGQNPFRVVASPVGYDGPVVVLTRASIRTRALWDFWRNAPRAAEGLTRAEGLIFSSGVGELPFVRQATLSAWENPAAMRAFAYGGENHQAAMRRKAEQNWYSEELFARFVPVASEGTYYGINPLEQWIVDS